MKYIAVLGREPEISVAELSALFGDVKQFTHNLAVFETNQKPDINRLGGTMKLGVLLEGNIVDYFLNLADENGEKLEHKITIGVSDYSKNATKNSAMKVALKIKRLLSKNGRSVRILENKEAELSTAA